MGQVQRQGKSKGTAQTDQCANRDAGDDGGALRELASRAMVIGKPTKDANGMATATFAMSPDEAAAVLQVQEYAAIIAVTR